MAVNLCSTVTPFGVCLITEVWIICFISVIIQIIILSNGRENKSFVTERDQCPEGALTPNLKKVTVQKQLHCSKILRTNFKYENQ